VSAPGKRSAAGARARGDREARPLARAGVVTRDLPDGTAVLDLPREAIHVLNPAAAFLLSLCDGTRAPDDLAAALRAAVPALSPRQAERDVRRGLAELAAAGLLAGTAGVRAPRTRRRGR
jgi:hypothetical protein